MQAPGMAARIQRGNRLLEVNGDQCAYDDRDHLSRREGPSGKTTYQYDSRDLLVGIEGPGLSYTAVHDGLGRRTRKTVNGKTWHYYWDSDRLAAEVFSDGRLRVYVYPDAFALVPMLFLDYDSVDANPASGKRYHLYTDHLGCPELVLDDAAKTVWRARIDPYGTAHVDIGADFHQPLRWPGHYLDAETGLHDNRFRTYSPELGRYLQCDPSGTEGGINLYAYTENPLRAVDLRGQEESCPEGTPDCPFKKEGGDDKEGVKEGDVGSYKDLNKKAKKGDHIDHDHIPAFASVRDAVNAQRAKAGLPKLNDAQERALKNNLTTMAVEPTSTPLDEPTAARADKTDKPRMLAISGKLPTMTWPRTRKTAQRPVMIRPRLISLQLRCMPATRARECITTLFRHHFGGDN